MRALHMESPQVEQERAGLEKSPGEKVSTQLVCVQLWSGPQSGSLMVECD